MALVFGYGSLVNHHTHDNRPLHAARLTGWQREWCGTRLRPAAFLSARPAPQGRIDGLVAPVPGGDWAALDAREHAYGRWEVGHQLDPAPPAPAYVYSVEPEHREEVVPHPILLSYLDVVVEGFRHHFGRRGVAAFFSGTAGWARPVLDDRAAPIYRRHRDVGAEVRTLTDTHLAAMGLRVTDA